MNKQDWIWVAIRIFGIYLIVLAITNLPEFISSAIQASHIGFGLPTLYDSDSASCRQLSEQFSVRAIGEFIQNGLKVLLFSVIGIYLIRSGKIIFKLISKNVDEQ